RPTPSRAIQLGPSVPLAPVARYARAASTVAGKLGNSLDESDTIEPAERSALPVVRAPGLTILYHPDAARVGERVLLGDLSLGKPVGLSRSEPLFAPPAGGVGRGLADPCVSRKPVVLQQERGKQQLTIDPRGMALMVDGTSLREPGVVPLA